MGMVEDAEVLALPERAVADGPAGERELPVLALTNNVLFPHGITPFFVGHEQSQATLEAALTADRMVLAVARRSDDCEAVRAADLYRVGVEAQVTRVVRLPDGPLNILLRGVRRMEIVSVLKDDPLLIVRGAPVVEHRGDSLTLEAERRAVLG